ncbi:unnamed protein product [Rangifer tarandus platyrhynchus]|uniref:Uncharacterized protein n=1 Tax=Rangifer tarandus platyrhynchus TaxID=3082113 RepID=A0ABN8YFW9_RANTA|nr:unnamed protein product [Rangifer tarandus platyrhynchus]
MRPLPVSAPPRVLSAAERPPPSRSASPASNATSSRKPSEADARVCLLLGAARMPLSPSLTPAGDSVPAPVEAVGEALLKTEDQAGLSQQEQSGGQGDRAEAGRQHPHATLDPSTRQPRAMLRTRPGVKGPGGGTSTLHAGPPPALRAGSHAGPPGGCLITGEQEGQVWAEGREQGPPLLAPHWTGGRARAGPGPSLSISLYTRKTGEATVPASCERRAHDRSW